jgi:hypothetical protein
MCALCAVTARRRRPNVVGHDRRQSDLSGLPHAKRPRPATGRRTLTLTTRRAGSIRSSSNYSASLSATLPVRAAAMVRPGKRWMLSQALRGRRRSVAMASVYGVAFILTFYGSATPKSLLIGEIPGRSRCFLLHVLRLCKPEVTGSIPVHHSTSRAGAAGSRSFCSSAPRRTVDGAAKMVGDSQRREGASR